jgi:hypothetical protein
VIAQEGKPTLRRVRGSRSTPYPAGDAALRNLKTEHDEFAVNAWSAPGGILDHYFEYQLTDLFGHRLSADRLTHGGDQLPIKPNADTVPAVRQYRATPQSMSFSKKTSSDKGGRTIYPTWQVSGGGMVA